MLDRAGSAYSQPMPTSSTAVGADAVSGLAAVPNSKRQPGPIAPNLARAQTRHRPDSGLDSADRPQVRPVGGQLRQDAFQRLAPFGSVRPGIEAAAERLRAAGHEVLTVDQYDGRVFEDYDEADADAQSIGYPELMRRAAEAVEKLSDGFVVAGFSNGVGWPSTWPPNGGSPGC